MRETHPSLFDRIETVLLPKNYLRLWLTGEKVAEMSDAAGTSWLDTGARDWSDALLAKTGLSRAAMPRLIEGSDISGTLRAELAARWGLGAAVPVAGGAGECGLCYWDGCKPAGPGLCFAWHIGRAVCRV